MMEKGKKYILIAPAVIIFVLILILRTAVWGEYLQSELNKRIITSGWSVEVERSSGYLIGTTILNKVDFKHTNGSSIGIEKASINIGVFSSLIGFPVLDLLTVEGMHLNYIDNDYSMDSSKQSLKKFLIIGRMERRLRNY